MAATTDAQFTKAVEFAKTHANFVFAVSQLDGVKLEDVVRASMHAWIRDETDKNYDEQMDFKGALCRAVVPLMGVTTAKQHKDEEAAARRAARALKPAANKKSPPPLREKSERIEKAEKDRAAAAEQAAKKRAAPKKDPAPKKKKKAPPGWRAGLAKALDPSKTGRPPTFALACAPGGLWNGTQPVGLNYVPLSVGWPEGTEETTVGACMFRDTKPSKDGVYTFHKIVYEPIKSGQHYKKTDEVVHYRKVKESDVPAIKEKLGLDF